MKKNKYGIPATVSEMASHPTEFKVDVPFAQGVNIDEITKDDPDPLFVTIEALNPQISGNGRHWTEESLYDVAKQVNTKRPDGYMGHLKEEDRPSKSPEAMTIWLGAVVSEVAGKKRLFVKGYVLPYATKLKQYLRKAQAAGKQVAVSVYGQAREVLNKAINAYDVKDFVLESIDWARPGSQGIATAGAVSLTQEMEEGEMKKADFMKALTLDQLRTDRPEIIQEMVREIEPDLRRSITESLESRLVAEMQNTIDGLMREKAMRVVDEMLNERVALKSARIVLRRLVISEMNSYDENVVKETVENILGSDEAKTVISEMIVPNKGISPHTDERNRETRKWTNIS